MAPESEEAEDGDWDPFPVGVGPVGEGPAGVAEPAATA